MVPQLSIHFEQMDAVRDVVNGNENTQYVFVVDPPLENPFPGKKVIGRVYDKYEESYTSRGAEGAMDWYSAHREFILARPYVWAWATDNEIHGNRETNAAYIETLIELLHKDNLRAIGGHFSAGEPEPEDAAVFAPAVSLSDGWAFHEYWIPDMWGTGAEGWYMWRYKKFISNLPEELRNKPLFITEAGIDGGTGEGSKKRVGVGWRGYVSSEEYVRQCKKYASGCNEYNVKSIFFYDAGPYKEWESFRIGVEEARELIKDNVKEVEEVATSSTQVRVLTPSGMIETMEVEEYLRGVVCNEVPASWPEEALKAQAVAARSYALANKGKHAAKGYDLCSTTDCQVYTTRRDSRTDAAIKATAGIVGVNSDGKILPAFFSALCGGSTTDLSFDGSYHVSYLKSAVCGCQQHKVGTNGHRRGLCQWGAYAMASAGKDYLTILNTYYNMIWRKDYGMGAVMVAPSDIPTTPEGPLPQAETAMDIVTLSQKVRWHTENAVRQLEKLGIDKSSYAMKIMYGLINLDDGLMYRLENAIKEVE